MLADAFIRWLAHKNHTLQAENSRLRSRVAELEALASTDPLTGLGNRRYFDVRLDEECARARRNADSTFSLVIIDVDNMKKVNDRFGHDVGDSVLKAVASLIDGNLRAQDVSCRVGGDEFAMILPGTDGASAAQLVGRLRSRQPDTLPVSISAGIATWGEDSSDGIELFRLADARMYREKRKKKRSAGWGRRPSGSHRAA